MSKPTDSISRYYTQKVESAVAGGNPIVIVIQDGDGLHHWNFRCTDAEAHLLLSRVLRQWEGDWE